MRREDLHDVAAHAKRAAMKVDVVALVLNVDETPQQTIAPELLPHLEVDQHLLVPLRRADAVDARDTCDDDDVAPREQRSRGAVAHAVDLVVDDRVLLDVGVARRDVRFGLVVVVVADEVLDGVVRKELPHLAVELCGEGLVGGHDQRRPLGRGDDVGDGEGLPTAGNSEQNLVRSPRASPSKARKSPPAGPLWAADR